MAGPFPGMDPYLEAQGDWPDFHNALIAEIRSALGERLPDDYIARSDVRIEVVGPDLPEPIAFRPDVLIAHRPPFQPAPAGPPGLATIEPVLVDVVDRDPEEVRHAWVEIRRLPDRELVTVIEVLSPINKNWPGRPRYLAKRDELHARKVHLVEIDLLVTGPRLPMKQLLPTGDYFAIVARGPRLPTAEVYAWSVRSPLPKLPIPLRDPDPDVVIDLQILVDRVYTTGRYARTLRHDRPLADDLPLRPDDRAWAEGLAGPAS